MNGALVSEQLTRVVRVNGERRVDWHIARAVEVQYSRTETLGPKWLIDWVRLLDSDGRVVQTEIGTRQRGHRTEGIYGYLRFVGLHRPHDGRSLADRELDAMPSWLPELVAVHLPGAELSS